MTIRLDRFGTTTLPNYNPKTPVGTGGVKDALVDVPGDGAYDAWSTHPAPGKPYHLRKKCTLYEEPVDGTHAALVAARTALQTALDALKALEGTRDKLFAVLLSDGSERWAWARCVKVDGTREPGAYLTQVVEIDFLVNPPFWHGVDHGGWTFDSGEDFDDGLYFDAADFAFTLDGSPKSVTVTNGGNKIVDDMIITVTAGSAAITALDIKKYYGATIYGHVSYSGTIAIGKSLVIDCGAVSVVNDGTGDANHFTIESDHRNDRWIRLNVGDNTIVITYTCAAADSTIEFSFKDQWK